MQALQTTQKTESADMIQTVISISYRTQSDSEKKICINMNKQVVDHMRLNGTRHVMVKRKGTRYTLTFMNVRNAMSTKVPAVQKDRVQLFLNTQVIQVPGEDQIKAVKYDAFMSADGNIMMFDFDLDEFLKPKPLGVTKVVESRDDKIEFGFKPDSDWGVALDEKVDDLIREQHRLYFACKFGNL